MEVLDIDIPVGGSLPLTPQQKTFLGRCFWGESEFTGICYIAMMTWLCVFYILSGHDVHRRLARFGFFGFYYPTFHRNVLDGEAEDDSPDHSESHLHVTVHNLWKANNLLQSLEWIIQFGFLLFYVCEFIMAALSYIHIYRKVLGTFSSNGDQFHSFARDEVQRFVDISNLVKPHLPSVWLG